ncbi:MAG: BNR-4 repeat-containing protein [Verrucomicrobia bacterium]|nr:BNR-4 repeat-containing protein [Verrucomicrobiota bacterium]MCH8526972.1 BNR repeat-containing protein [Kiritimatiellia bacterium]
MMKERKRWGIGIQKVAAVAGIFPKHVAAGVALGVCIGLFAEARAQKIERHVLAEQTTFPGHSVTDVYTPVGHARGHTFLVTPDENHHPVVIQATPSGEVRKVFLDPEHGVEDAYRAFPDPHNHFSLGVDKRGYVHITGDMHQFGSGHARHGGFPYPERYDDKKNAAMLYWRSVEPWDITAGFRFMGAKDSPYRMPGASWTYGRFARDRDGELYYSSRVRSKWAKDYRIPGSRQGAMAFGLYRYDVDSERWRAVGAAPAFPNPDNVAQAFDVLYWTHSGRADTGQSYQAYQAQVNFDVNNRMHFNASSYVEPGEVSQMSYAYSDDGGETWYRADGSRIPGLPLRGEQDEENHAHFVANSAGGSAVIGDRGGRPASSTGHSARSGWRVWNGSEWVVNTSIPGYRGYARPDGRLFFTAGWGIWLVDDLAGEDVRPRRLGGGIRSICQGGVLETGNIYGVLMNSERTKLSLVKGEFVEE